MTQDTQPPAPTVSVDQNLDDFLGVKPAKPWRKWIKWGLIALAVIILLLVLKSCFGAGDAPEYVTRAARKGDLTVTVAATGNLKPVNQVDVSSEQSGLITQVYVDVNDRVTKGQIVATLDPSRLADSVNQARAQVAAAQASAALAQATLARQENVFQLSGGKVPSKTELDAARAQARQANANVDLARAQLSVAQTDLSKTRIYSPVNGVVLAREVEPGQTVAASLNAPVLFTIAEDLTQMEVEVAVDEADVGQVKQGQPASFTVDAFPGENFPAIISRVNVGSNASSSSSSTSTTTTTATNTVVAYTAVLTVSNPKEQLRPGMTATADIMTKELKGVLLVPNAALRFNPSAQRGGGGITSTLIPSPRRGNRAARSVSFGAGSSQTVYVVGEDGRPKAVKIIVGDSDGNRTAVIGGDLKVGMEVITGQLAAGQKAPEADKEDGASSQPQRQGGERRKQGAAGNGN